MRASSCFPCLLPRCFLRSHSKYRRSCVQQDWKVHWTAECSSLAAGVIPRHITAPGLLEQRPGVPLGVTPPDEESIAKPSLAKSGVSSCLGWVP